MSNETEELFEKWMLFENSEESYFSKVIFSVSLLILFILSLVGNILTCVVTYYDKSMHTITNYYLFNLAISDLLITFPILIIIYQILTPDGSIFEYKSGVFSCHLYVCIQSMFCTLLWNHSILVMTALSIERYIAICYPMKLKSTSIRKRVFKTILAIWIIAITETIPLIWTLGIVDTGKSLRCSFVLTYTVKIIQIFSVVTMFILPLGVMILMYAMIAYKIRDHQKHGINETTVFNSIYKRKNVTNLIVATTVSFVVCWLPTYSIVILIYFTDKKTVEHFQWWLHIGDKIAVFNIWLTTVLNPFLFSLISIRFRKAFKVLWNKQSKKISFRKKKNDNMDANP